MTDWNIMLDCETLSLRPDAALLQIGAVLFEPKSGGKIFNGCGFNQNILVQDGAGSIDHSTLVFWLEESSAKQMGENLRTKALPLQEVLQLLNEWPEEVCSVRWEDVGGVWAKPSDKDIPWLTSAYARFGGEPPWHYQSTRCAQTLFSLTGIPEINWTGLTPHDALDDAIGQAMMVQKAMGILTGGVQV